jgi:hypothetical protein
MCMACEEEALWRRYQLALAVERDEIPPGFEPEDFEWAGLPVPSKRALPSADESVAENSLPHIPEQAGIQDGEQGDVSSGSTAASSLVRGGAENGLPPSARQAANPFACDAPDKT